MNNMLWADGFGPYEGLKESSLLSQAVGRLGSDVLLTRIQASVSDPQITWFQDLPRLSLFKRLMNAFFPRSRTFTVELKYNLGTGVWETLHATIEVPGDATYAELDLSVKLSGEKSLDVGEEPVFKEIK